MAVPAAFAPLVYGLLNIASATGIVFANKSVFSIFQFHFTYALTLIHTLTTVVGMQGFLRMRMFEVKQVPRSKLAPLAAAYVGYIVLCNLNLNLNPVGFYQITKIAVAPAVLAIDYFWYGRKASTRVTLSVLVVCLGVGLATITDPQISSNMAGLAAGFGSVAATALYQIWAGSKQKELGLGSMQLLHQYVPLAAGMLAVLVPLCEPMGWRGAPPGSLLGYVYSPGAVVAIAISAVLGLLVNLSTFLVIGATSSLTYNVVGHIKTVLILSGGVAFFGDTMPPKKAAGIAAAMGGIIWYSQIKLSEARASASAKLLPHAVSVTAIQSADASGVPAAADKLLPTEPRSPLNQRRSATSTPTFVERR
ncbi:Solute carrier family 35 member E3 isoform A [Micractinium conductrix]|uniref:Solute carrier family 35 member E3 isoform A n=1 Tax=Micractinium conductrix TaxID=554055 RepID=A0A2P6VM46_9CHLO|nr:Solute carrier family 35 member E3 isoform A [Micractinium conductrix]|eukprot:PSC75159.1 Solute carrier family 35 member E3 isoform A [Micractinium conductrix]